MSFNEINRKNWLEKTLKSIPEGQSILDAGAGELANKIYCSHLKYVSQDFCEYKGNSSEKGLQFDEWDTGGIDIVSDIINIPVEDNSFDNILCSEVFEHIVDPISAIKEFSRIVRPGGQIIVTAPFCSLVHMAPYHFSSGYSRYWYEEILQKNGFRVVEIKPNGNYFSFILQELERLPYMFDMYEKALPKGLIRNISKIRKNLEMYEQIDDESSSTLCFGYFVRGVKE